MTQPDENPEYDNPVAPSPVAQDNDDAIGDEDSYPHFQEPEEDDHEDDEEL